MFEALLFGIPLFWYAFIALTVIMLVALEYENGWSASISLIVFLSIMWWFGDLGPVFSVAGLSTLVAIIIGYLFIGAAWSVAKWYLFLIAAREWYDNHSDEVLKSGYFNTNPFFSGSDDIPPKVGNHKAQIMMWIAYWPWSAFWTLTNDPIRKIVKTIYNSLGQFMQRMSNKVFEGVR